MKRKSILISDNLHKFILAKATENSLSMEEQLKAFIRNDTKSQKVAETELKSDNFVPNGNSSKELNLYLNTKNIFRNYADIPKAYYTRFLTDIGFALTFLTSYEELSVPLEILPMHVMSATVYKEYTLDTNGIGFCYIVKTHQKNVYKIGKSNTPTKRVKAITGTHILTFRNEEVETYLLNYYRDRIIYLQDATSVSGESVYLTENDITNIVYGMKDYIEFIDNAAIKECLTINGFIYESTEQVLNSFCEANNLSIETGATMFHSILQGNKTMEKDMHGLIHYARITNYETLKNRLSPNIVENPLLDTFDVFGDF